GEPQLVDACLLVLEIRQPALSSVAPGAVERFPGQVDADHLPRSESLREAARDTAGSTTHVEKPHAGSQMRQEERRRLVRRALSVLLEGRRRMAMRVLLVANRLVGHAPLVDVRARARP